VSAPVDFASMRAAVAALLVIGDELAMFDNTDGPMARVLSSRVRTGIGLTVEQTRAAWRLLHRYREHPLFPSAPELPAAAPPPVDGTAAARPAPSSGPASSARMRPDDRIGITAPFEFKDAIKALPGARWDKVRKQWHIPATPAAAGELVSMLDRTGVQLSERVAALAAEHHARPVTREILDETTPLPNLAWSAWTKSDPWSHQRRGLVFMSESSAALLAVTMGGGKTLTAIGAANRAQVARLLIVCPRKVLGVWPREFRRHSAREWHIVNGLRRTRTGSEAALSVAQRFEQAQAHLFDCACGLPHAVVVNYETLTYEPWASWKPVTDDGSTAVGAVIYDEIHRLRGEKVGKVAEKYSRWIGRRWGLTGTPMPQSPLDVFGPFRALDSGIYGSTKTAFRAKYAIMGGFENKQVIGLNRAEELSRRFFSITYMPVIELDLPDLLPDVTIEVDLEPEARRVYDALDGQVWAELTSAVVAAGGTHDPERDDVRTVSPANAAVLLLRLQQVAGGATMDDAGDVAIVSRAKQDALAALLPELGCEPRTAADDGAGVRPEPVVVFCRFRHDLDAVREVAYEAGLVYAEVSGRRGDGLTSDSEMTPDADIVGVQIQSGGTGVDLTRARYGVWYSMGFSLSDYMQGRARQHRPGQLRSVQFVHLVARDTVDTEVYAALDARQDVISAVLALHGSRGVVVDLPPEAWSETSNPDGVDKAANMVALPAEVLAFAPNARIGSPSGSAKGRLAGTRASQRQADSVTMATVGEEFGLDGF
jgi:hypothetical protein